MVSGGHVMIEQTVNYYDKGKNSLFISIKLPLCCLHIGPYKISIFSTQEAA